jgi:inner membrane protein
MNSIAIPFLGTLNHPGMAATVFFLFGLILPDVDSPHSHVSRRVPAIHSIANMFTKHRGLVHSIFTGILITIGIGFFLNLGSYDLAIAGWFLIGYLIHLSTDALTPHGVKPFAPFSPYTIRGPIRSGSNHEKIISLVVYSAALLLIAKNFTTFL